MRGSRLTAMKIYHNSYAYLSGPSNGLVQISKLSLHVGFARQRSHGPVSNRYADVIQTSLSNLEKVIPRDPGFPMAIQTPQCFVMSQDLAEGVFILHLLACCPWLKNRWGNPRFENKPSAQVHAANFLNVEVEIDISGRRIPVEGVGELRIFVCAGEWYKSVTYSEGAACALASKHRYAAVRFREHEKCIAFAYALFFSSSFRRDLQKGG